MSLQQFKMKTLSDKIAEEAVVKKEKTLKAKVKKVKDKVVKKKKK